MGTVIRNTVETKEGRLVGEKQQKGRENYNLSAEMTYRTFCRLRNIINVYLSPYFRLVSFSF